MAYNSENNIDDLIALANGKEETFYLILEDYDGKGVFATPPFVYGLSQVIQVFHKDELQKTIGDILLQYPEGRQFMESDDAFNLITGKHVRVTPQDTLEHLFAGDHKAVLYLQNQAYSAYHLFDEQPQLDDNQKTIKKFNWKRCLLIFSMCWVIKFFIMITVLYLLRQYQVI